MKYFDILHLEGTSNLKMIWITLYAFKVNNFWTTGTKHWSYLKNVFRISKLFLNDKNS